MDHKEKVNPVGDHGETRVSNGVKVLPASPGVYIMKDEKGVTLYVGKAGNLKKRVSSYFHSSARHNERIRMLVENVKDISFLPTATEAEALIYENSLIKKLAPKYNVALKDDKSYPMLKLTVNEKFPRLFITRQKKGDGAVYYGPYTSAKLLKEAIIILRQIFPLRSCGKMKKSVCLNYHIKQCMAPCAEKVSESNYGEIVSELKLFLEGKRTELLNHLSEKMNTASKQEDFEEAGRLKQRLEALASIRERTVNYSPASEIGELKSLLKIENALDIIEAVDVSNIMGKEAVGSLVYFYKGKPKKSEYRHFKIQGVSQIDDYAMIKEIVRRRYARLLEEKKNLPDLILIDGGKGHLAAAVEALRLLGVSGIPAIGIAKEFEHIYAVGRREPIILPRESKALHLLERIRDEAHRFAISHHKKLRSKNISISELDDIPGIGEKRKKALIVFFGNVDKIKTATLDELMKVKGMNEKSAQSIVGYFKR